MADKSPDIRVPLTAQELGRLQQLAPILGVSKNTLARIFIHYCIDNFKAIQQHIGLIGETAIAQYDKENPPEEPVD